MRAKRRMRASDWSSDPRLEKAWVDHAVVGITLLAIVLGGTTSQWAQGIIVMLGALIILMAPPRSWPDRLVWIAALLLVGLAMVTFLPVAWMPAARWRIALLPDPDFAIPGTFTPQPWRSLQCVLLMIAGLVWLSYLLARERVVSRERLLMLYAGGVGVLALTCLIFYTYNYRPSFWQTVSRFGPFPNKNQTLNVFALGALMQLALAFHAFNRRSLHGFIWMIACLITAVAVIVPAARAGVLILFGSGFAWILWVTWKTRRMKTAGIALSALFAGLTLFMAAGGKTWEEIHRHLNPHMEPPVEGRLAIQRDALDLWKDAGLRGVGPGNFAPAFAQYRVRSLNESHAIHPESDWLWLGAELGWLAPLIVLGAFGAYLWRNWPRPEEGNFHLRAAVAVGVIAFVLHGFVDVAGHRMGSVLPAMFLLSLLQQRPAEPRRQGIAETEEPDQGSVPPRFRFSGDPRKVALVYRGIAAGLMLVAAWWLGGAAGLAVPPTIAHVERAKARIEKLQEIEDMEGVARVAHAALRWAPVDASLHFYRGMARVLTEAEIEGPWMDFSRARHFQPNNGEICMVEGTAWLGRRADLALTVWEEALRRVRRHRSGVPGRALAMYREMLAFAVEAPVLRPALRRLAGNDRGMLLAYLEGADPETFQAEVERLLSEDEGLYFLNEAQRRKLFVLWTSLGDLQMLETLVAAHPEWRASAWVGLAIVQAIRGDLQEACRVAEEHSEPPALPSMPAKVDLRELRLRFVQSPGNFFTGYALYSALLAEGDHEGALLALQKMIEQRGCPPYAHYLEAHLLARRQDWDAAWRAWQRYFQAAGLTSPSRRRSA